MTCKVVGLDLSLTSTGMAGVDGGQVWGLERIKTTGKKGDDLMARRVRISGITQDVFQFVRTAEPVLVVIESPSYGSLHGSPHDRSGLWWLVTDMLHELEIPVATVSPQGRAKYGTGNGRAKKPEVYAAVKEQYPDLTFSCDDEADALLLAAMGARYLGEPCDPWLTGRNLEAIDAAAWPTEVAA